MTDKINILIVEDEGVVAMELEESLQAQGYDIADIVDNCYDACEAHRKHVIDLILLDVNLKGPCDGIEAKKERKQESKESMLHFNNSIFIKQNYKFIKIALDDIFYLEADSNYTYIYTAEKKYAIRHSLQNVMDRLMLSNFVRTHRSYAVNINHLSTFNDNSVSIGKYDIPLGRNYKETFFKHFNFL
jgi:DNA-binding LytR/AlgR family response regulator